MISTIFEDRFPLLKKTYKAQFWVGCFSIFGAFLCLGTLFVKDQFEFPYVWQRSMVDAPTKYKVASIWSGQQGSFLLWAVTSSIFGLLAAPFTGAYRRWFTTAYAFFLGSLCGILAYESPFNLDLINGKVFMPPNGVGITPTLQNYWVVIHPPTIFMGFGSLTVMFAWAVAAMITKDRLTWAKQVRPWALTSVAILGLGLCMGGFWAYETLGWGGFWAWDPVENVSFVPWIMTAALVHGLMVHAGKGRMIRSNLLLAGLPFLLFVYGTFLTRSGWYSDVSNHSFAKMEQKALYILIGLFGACTLGFGALWAMRSKEAEPIDVTSRAALNKESLYRFGAIVLAGISVTTAIGMSVPLLMSIIGGNAKIVEEKHYHLLLAWFAVPMLVLMAATPFISWRGAGLKETLSKLGSVLGWSVGLTGMTIFIVRNPGFGVGLTGQEVVNSPFGKMPALPWISFLLFLCWFVAIANVNLFARLAKRGVSSAGGFVAHIGVSVLLAGMIFSRGFERSAQVLVQEGLPGQGLGYVINYKQHTSKIDDRDNKVLFDVTSPDGSKFEIRPGFYYSVNSSGEQSPTVWPHIERWPSHDLYFALHPAQFDLWEKPLSMKPGDTHKDEGVTVTYEKFLMEGQPGQPGTKFGAKLHMTDEQGLDMDLSPMMELGSDGITPGLASAGNQYMVSVVPPMDVATHSLNVQVHFARPLYPLEVFYKPMTILVWLGAGILFVGGIMSAANRRPQTPVEEDAPTTEPQKEDALVPTIKS